MAQTIVLRLFQELCGCLTQVVHCFDLITGLKTLPQCHMGQPRSGLPPAYVSIPEHPECKVD